MSSGWRSENFGLLVWRFRVYQVRARFWTGSEVPKQQLRRRTSLFPAPGPTLHYASSSRSSSRSSSSSPNV